VELTERTTAAFDALRALHETPTIEAAENVVDTNRPWHSGALFDADFPAYHRLTHELFAFISAFRCGSRRLFVGFPAIIKIIEKLKAFKKIVSII
jgi:hypothetical protein